MSTISRNAQFNSWKFTSTPYLAVYALSDQSADRTLSLTALARHNSRKLASSWYQKRSIDVSVYITAPSRALADQALDTLFQNIQAEEGTLTLERSGKVRNYTATFAKLNINEFNGGFVDLTLTFECSDSYGYDTTYTLLGNATGITVANYTSQFTQGGGALWQVPFIQLRYTAVNNGGNPGTIYVGNQTTGQQIVITRTWSANDLVQIDCLNKTVQVNGTDVSFTGAFPEFNTGLQTVYVNDNFSTSRTYNFYMYCYQRWN